MLSSIAFAEVKTCFNCMDLIETNLTESRLITPRNKINLLLLTTLVNIIGRQGAFEKINKKANILLPGVICCESRGWFNIMQS